MARAEGRKIEKRCDQGLTLGARGCKFLSMNNAAQNEARNALKPLCIEYKALTAKYEAALSAKHAELDATMSEPGDDASDEEWSAYDALDNALNAKHEIDTTLSAIGALTDQIIDMQFAQTAELMPSEFAKSDIDAEMIAKLKRRKAGALVKLAFRFCGVAL